jgi:acetyl esterase/lipase
VIVFPGGGYCNLAPHEAEPIARWLNEAGFSAFVLRYRVHPYQHPIPWNDASRAVRMVRARAAEWKVRPNKIAVLGFSAGGHLAATISTHNDLGRSSSNDPVEQVSSRPDASILCYPVITFDSRYYHGGSLRSLLGDTPDPQLVAQFSAENAVSAQTPPTFLWHTANDASVPLENSLLYAGALHRCGVPVELHVFPNGRHGLGLAADDPAVGSWTGLCAKWLKALDF